MSASPATEFSLLMEQVRDGVPGAVQTMIDRYGQHLMRVIRRKLHQKIRTKFDSQDFCQAVWASFFALPAEKYTFDKPEELLRFLVDLARNKVVEAVRQRMVAQKYNVNREVSLTDQFQGGVADVLPGREPTPSTIAMAREEWENLLDRQSDRHRRILALLNRGQTHREVAQELGVNEKTIQRVLRKLFPHRTYENQ
jgi:RNA polymerase sigma factor (sigma-70 family)